MSWRFSGTDQGLTIGDVFYGSYPISVSCWFRPDRITGAAMVFWVQRDAGAAGSDGLIYAPAGDNVQTNSNSGAAAGLSPTGVFLDVWQHGGGSFETASRYGVLNGIRGAPDTTSSPMGGSQVVTDFCQVLTSNNEVEGSMAEFAMWSAVLDVKDWALLGAGYSPLFVRPRDLVVYYPLSFRALPYPAGSAGRHRNLATLESIGLPFSEGDHPRIIYPKQNVYVPFREKLLDLATFEKPVTSMPPRPPR